MGVIKPIQKNRRICEKCNAGYVINGDESEYWCQIPTLVDDFGVCIKKEGLCEFCRQTGKYSLNKNE
jgi:hypothetical protein